VLIFQLCMCKAAKAENRGRVTSQPPRGAAGTQQRSGKHNAGGGATGQPPKAGQEVDPRSLGQRAAFKTELPHLAGGGGDQTELQLKGNTAATR
jgi:hypothetical protein